jgi:hypothetical protein
VCWPEATTSPAAKGPAIDGASMLSFRAGRSPLSEGQPVEDLDLDIPDAVPVTWVEEAGLQPTRPDWVQDRLGPKVFLAVRRGSSPAVETAARLASARGGSVRVIHVRERIPTAMGPFYYETVEQAARRLQAVILRLHQIGVTSISGAVTAPYSARRLLG